MKSLAAIKMSKLRDSSLLGIDIAFRSQYTGFEIAVTAVHENLVAIKVKSGMACRLGAAN